MMRAIKVKKFGPPSVLQLQTVDILKATNSKVLVKIASAGVNPVDTYIREGAFISLPKLPYTPGKDAAGVLQEVGENVTRFKKGQRVFMCGRNLSQHGTYAEYSLVNECDVFPLDEKLSFDEGAALGVPYFTAFRALILKAKCVKGETVLIHGASGAVGLAAIQIAKHNGLKVIGTAGTVEGMTLAKETGSDYVFSHKENNYMEKILEVTDNKGVDIVIEMLANVNLDKDFDVLAPKGRVAIVGSRGSIKIDPRKMMGGELNAFGVAVLSSTEEEWDLTAKGILEGITEGWIKPIIDKKYPLEKASEAQKDIIHSPGAKGKLILTVQEL